MFFSINIKRAGRHWIWYRLISGKTPHPSHPHIEDTSKPWDKNNQFKNYWFPFGLSSLLRNFLYVKSYLSRFDQFGPHPNIAQAKLSGQTPESMQPYQTQNIVFLWQLTDMTNSFISWMWAVFDLLIFSHMWTHIKDEAIQRKWRIGHPVFIWVNPSHAEAKEENEDWWMTWGIDIALALPDLEYCEACVLHHCIQTYCLRICHCAILQPLLCLSYA